MSPLAFPEPKSFLAAVTLSPSDLGLYSAIRQAKRATNDEAVSAMVAFCLQLLATDPAGLNEETSLSDDLDRTVMSLSADLRRLGHLLAGAEKVLLDGSALREQMARQADDRS